MLKENELEEYDGTQSVDVALLMPGGKVEEFYGLLRKYGYVMYFKAQDAPDAVVRFPTVGHAIRLRQRKEVEKNDDASND